MSEQEKVPTLQMQLLGGVSTSLVHEAGSKAYFGHI
jgi:hypothetical protein